MSLTWIIIILIFIIYFYPVKEGRDKGWKPLKVKPKQRLWKKERVKGSLIIKRRLKNLFNILFSDNKEYYKK